MGIRLDPFERLSQKFPALSEPTGLKYLRMQHEKFSVVFLCLNSISSDINLVCEYGFSYDKNPFSFTGKLLSLE